MDAFVCSLARQTWSNPRSKTVTTTFSPNQPTGPIRSGIPEVHIYIYICPLIILTFLRPFIRTLKRPIIWNLLLSKFTPDSHQNSEFFVQESMNWTVFLPKVQWQILSYNANAETLKDKKNYVLLFLFLPWIRIKLNVRGKKKCAEY